jgi:AsmA protein
VTAALGLKRAGLAVAALVATGFVAVTTMSVLIPADTVRDAVKAEIRAVTGLDPVFRGVASVSLFPAGSVSFADVGLGDDQDGASPLRAERLTARLQFFPLLTGRIEISDISLVRPTITVTYDSTGRSNWARLAEALVKAVAPNQKRVASFSEIHISNGTVVVHDDVRNINETLTSAELSLAWPSISKSFAATGRFVWRDEPIDLSVSMGDFAAALSGERSGLKVRLAGAPFKLAFDGYMASHPTLRVAGTLAADSASLRDAMRWAGQKPFGGGGFGRFALKAQTNVVGGVVSLSGVNVELDGNTAEGVLTFAGDGRQALQGTLAADTIDLTPYVSTMRLLSGRERDWSRVPISLEVLASLDLDVRLSAARVILSSSAKLGRTAIGANLRGGKLTVAVGESQAFGGVIKGSLAFARADAGADLKAELQFTDVDLESCINEMFGIRRLEGRGNLAFSIDGSGPSVLAVAQTLNGSASLTGHDGALGGVNVEQALKGWKVRPLSGGGELRSGRTPFDKLSVTIKIAQGTATVEDVNVEGPAVRLGLIGSASIPDRDLDLKGTAALLAVTSANAGSSFELPFVVHGPWDNPDIVPDPQFLIRRSPAAAPFFPKISDEKLKELDSLVKRWNGAPTTDAPSDAAAPPPASQPLGQAEAQPPGN